MNVPMKKIVAVLTSLGSLAVTTTALAATQDFTIVAPPGKTIPASTSIGTIINNALVIIFSVAALLVLVMLIIGAMQWILSGGDKEAVQKARERITAALIGLAILALAFLIVNVVGNIVGFGNILDIKLPNLGGS